MHPQRNLEVCVGGSVSWVLVHVLVHSVVLVELHTDPPADGEIYHGPRHGFPKHFSRRLDPARWSRGCRARRTPGYFCWPNVTVSRSRLLHCTNSLSLVMHLVEDSAFCGSVRGRCPLNPIPAQLWTGTLGVSPLLHVVLHTA
jgi:hypothetical protein